MSSLEQFETLVSDAGAVANRIARGPRGEERLVISVGGGLKEIPLHVKFSEDAATVTAAAERMVTTAKMLTGKPARNLSSSSPRESQSSSHR